MNKIKTALITGSSDGIGAEIAHQLSESGYKVFLTGRDQEKLIKQSKKYNVSGYFIGDLLRDNAVQELYQQAVNNLGNIDILVNNAGNYVWSPVEKTLDEDIKITFKLNLEVPYKLCKLVIPAMKKNRTGRIINIGSISGAVGEANASLYSASKSGLSGMTKALALELAEYGISANLVNPGWVKTGLAETYFDNQALCKTEEIEMIPQKRWIEPSEVAGLVKYLVSDEALGITGQAINLCCGLSLG